MTQRAYRIVYTPQAKRQPAETDNSLSRHIYSWIGERLDNSEGPRSLGRKPTGDLSGLIRYAIGDYCIIAQIFGNELVIPVIEAEHRKKYTNGPERRAPLTVQIIQRNSEDPPFCHEIVRDQPPNIGSTMSFYLLGRSCTELEIHKNHDSDPITPEEEIDLIESDMDITSGRITKFSASDPREEILKHLGLL